MGKGLALLTKRFQRQEYKIQHSPCAGECCVLCAVWSRAVSSSPRCPIYNQLQHVPYTKIMLIRHPTLHFRPILRNDIYEVRPFVFSVFCVQTKLFLTFDEIFVFSDFRIAGCEVLRFSRTAAAETKLLWIASFLSHLRYKTIYFSGSIFSKMSYLLVPKFLVRLPFVFCCGIFFFFKSLT